MEGTSSGAGTPGSSTFFARHQFLIYRLFSLAGVLPVGGYLVIHLLTNATVLNGAASFQTQVDRIHSLGVFCPSSSGPASSFQSCSMRSSAG